MPDSNNDEREIQLVAEQITRYLRAHNNVADTLDGIAQWWIVQQRIYEEKQRVQKALDYLCHQGLVQKRTLADGGELYSLVDGDKQ